MPSATNPFATIASLTDLTTAAHAANALHVDDQVPARIYSLNGDIVSGALQSSGGGAGFYDKLMQVVIDKPAMIQAGQDIVNLSFQGQNLRKSDVTRIVAGRDIYDTPLVRNAAVVPALTLGGPGYFDIEAGRNIGPLTSQSEAYAALTSAYPKTGLLTGINATGNASNPNLPHDSANVNILFGVNPGVDTGTFISKYVDPAGSIAGAEHGVRSHCLRTTVRSRQRGRYGISQGPTCDRTAGCDAGVVEIQEPAHVRSADLCGTGVVQLADSGRRRLQQCRESLFPEVLAWLRGDQYIVPCVVRLYGEQSRGGGNGTNKAIDTGDLDIRNTTIQTQQGGNISILGPGGQALVGSASAPPQIADTSGNVIVGPGAMGILTLEKGNVNIFTDRSVLLAQSRIFTEQGGNMTIWARTATSTPAKARNRRPIRRHLSMFVIRTTTVRSMRAGKSRVQELRRCRACPAFRWARST